MEPMEYIQQFYGVPAKVGGKITYKNRIHDGTIKGAENGYLLIDFGNNDWRNEYYHPTWGIKYH